jgi:transposase
MVCVRASTQLRLSKYFDRRKNWLHLGSKEAGPKIAAIFSVVESCRRLAVPIRKYLADVLPGMANRSIRTLADLTPTAYAAKLSK